TCSPVATTTSTSRSFGSSWICFVSASRRLVSPAIAETTMATSWPWRCVSRQRLATRFMRAMVPTDVPPYFCTMSMPRLYFAATTFATVHDHAGQGRGGAVDGTVGGEGRRDRPRPRHRRAGRVRERGARSAIDLRLEGRGRRRRRGAV